MPGFAMHLRRSRWVWICLGFLLLSRIPAILCPFELNRDEGQMAAQAMRYAQDLTPWRSVEGETNGPLDSWFLLAAHDAGIPLNYIGLHVLAALCLGGIVLVTYFAVRRLTGDIPALVGVAAGSWWLALAPVEDLVHYSSELVPLLLLGLGLATCLRATRATDRPDWRLGFFGGILLGLAPWGKMQAGPVAVVLALWAAADGWRAQGMPGRRYVAALAAGVILPAVLLLTWVVMAGAGEEFWRVYILGGLYHGRPRPWDVHLVNLEDLLFWRASSPWFWDAGLLALGALWLGGRAGWQKLPVRTRSLAALWLAIAIFVALRPITQWIHYSLFCLPPLVLCAALAAQMALGAEPLRHRGWVVLALGLLPLPAANFLYYHYYRAAETMLLADQGRAFGGQVFLDKAMRHFVPQPRSLAVWGWAPSLYVDLGLAPATRNAVCAFLTDDNPSRDFLRAAFIRDLEKSQPEEIVDTEDYVFRGQRKTAPDTFPALAGYLQQHYFLLGHGEVRRAADYQLVIDIYQRRSE
jgi:hypothetical protein